MPETTETSWPYPFPKEDWEKVPLSVRAYIVSLEQRLSKLEERITRNSKNSSQPPSADSPYAKRESKAKNPHGKPGGKKGHKAHSQQMLEPNETIPLTPERCRCGNDQFRNPRHYHTHQHIELPEMPIQVTHFALYKRDPVGPGVDMLISPTAQLPQRYLFMIILKSAGSFHELSTYQHPVPQCQR